MANNTPQQQQQLLQLPAGFHQLETQVAGHTFEATNAASIGLLRCSDGSGCVLKPLGKPDCGARELSFYETMAAAANEGDTLLTEARRLVPKFYQKLNLVVNNREHMFIKLEDLTHGMQKPCIMDIKVGKRTWDPLASPNKRNVEEKKYSRCKQTLGLCLPGFQVYMPQVKTNETALVRHGKDYGKSLDTNGFRKTIGMFLNVDTDTLPCCCAATIILIREVLQQLYRIRDWFKRQNIYCFYASSLLITYDYVQLQRAKTKLKAEFHINGINHRNNINDADCIVAPDNDNGVIAHDSSDNTQDGFTLNAYGSLPASQWVKVRMIDFAHVFPAESEKLDSNYLFGLESLINVIEGLIGG